MFTIPPVIRTHRKMSIAAAVGLLLCAVVFVRWPIPGAAGLAEKTALRAGIEECSIKGVYASLSGSLSLSGVSLTVPVDSKLRAIVAVPEIRLHYRPLYTLTHWSSIDDLIAGRDTSGALQGTAKAKKPSLKRVLGRLNPLLACVRQVHMNGGRVSIKGFGPWTIAAEKPAIDLHVVFDEKFKIKGSLRAASIGIDDVVLTKPSLRIDNRDSLVLVEKFRGRFFDGKVNGALDFNFATMLITSGRFELTNIDVRKIYSVAAVGGSMSGKADARLSIDTSGLSLPAINGHLALTLKNLVANDLPVVDNLFILGELSGLSRMKFSKFELEGDLSKGWAVVDTVHAVGDPLSLDASGKLRPTDGYFRFGINGVFAPHYKDSVSSLVWESMAEAPGGCKAVKGVLSGTFTSPSLSIDRSITRRAVQNVFNKGSSGVKGIFD